MSQQPILVLASLTLLAACSPSGQVHDSDPGSHVWDTGEAPLVEDLDDATDHIPELSINEFMAYDSPDPDWIELYNDSDELMDLSGSVLSSEDDDPQDPWVFPKGVTLESKGFLLIYCDNGVNEGDGELHASFALERHDGIIYWHDAQGERISAISYAYQNTGISAARSPDGGGIWFFDDSPTPGASNVAD